ncbi:unnamed protein product [Calypogeia fissa]
MKLLHGEEVSGVYDVVVVGAGIMGACTAYELAKRGKSVLLLEQYDFLHHRGSSHGESRIIRMSYPEEYYVEMMLEAFSLWEKAQQDAGYAVYTRSGGLDLGPVKSASLGSLIKSLQKFNVEHEILNPAQVLDRFSMMHIPEDWHAVYTKQGGIIHASKAVAMFLSLAGKHGATLRDRAKVTKITPNSSLDGTDGVVVNTSRGDALGRKCILAGGSWMGKLVADITGKGLPITPLHTTYAYWSVADESEAHLYTEEGGFPVFICYDVPFIYGTPAIEYPGMIKVSNHTGHPCNPDTRTVAPDMGMLQATVSPWIAEMFKGKVKHEAPAIAEGCLYSMTADEDFILDSLPSCPDILVAAGFSGHGFKMGPLIGRIMADLALTGAALGGESGSWLPHFSLKRFERGANGNSKIFDALVLTHELGALGI